MRSLWLASAASLFFAGAACAQTSMTGPAPTGAPNGATMTAPGQSPGNTAPSTMGSTMSAPPPAAMSDGGRPADNASGAPSGPTVTTPGASPGKTEMSTAGMAPSGTSSMAPPMHHHHYMGSGMGSMAMPADASAGKYLHIAKGALKHHNAAMADDALSHAETRMLDRSVPQGMIAADSDPGVSAIESARKAVKAGDMKTANMDIDMAMQQSGSMAGGMGGGPMGMSSGTMMAPTPAGTMSPPSLAHGNVTSSDAGGPPSIGSTSDSAAVGGNATMAHSPDKPASSP